MKRDELVQATTPEALVGYLRQAESSLAPGEHCDHGGAASMESIREATHRGHHIVIRTRYQIEVDGKPIEGHLGVTNDGQVHYHAIPNYSFASAVDLVKQVIDTFPDDFPAPATPSPHPAHPAHPAHDQEH
jgi:hypothetical protein